MTFNVSSVVAALEWSHVDVTAEMVSNFLKIVRVLSPLCAMFVGRRKLIRVFYVSEQKDSEGNLMMQV